MIISNHNIWVCILLVVEHLILQSTGNPFQGVLAGWKCVGHAVSSYDIWYMIWDDIFSIYWHIDIWYLIWYLLWYLKYTVALFNHICIIWYDITILCIKSFHIIRTIYRSKLVGQRDVEPTGNTWQTHEYICCERWKCVPLPNCIRHWKARSPFFKLHVWIPKSSKQGRGWAKKMQPFFRLDLIF